MTRQWRKEKQSELAKPGFSLAYGHYSTLIFHTLCRGGVLLSGVRTSENQITPGAHLYTPVHHQWTNSVLCDWECAADRSSESLTLSERGKVGE